MVSFYKLPEEILCIIFNALSPMDRKIAELVCKKWHRLLSHSRYTKNYPLTLRSCILGSQYPPMSVLMKSERRFEHVVFGAHIVFTTPEQLEVLCSFIGHANELTFTLPLDQYQNGGGVLHGILSKFPNLRQLTVEDVPDAILLGVNESNVKKIFVRQFRIADKQEFKQWRQEGRILQCENINLEQKPSERRRLLTNSIQVEEGFRTMMKHFNVESENFGVKHNNMLYMKRIGIKDITIADGMDFTVEDLTIFKKEIKYFENLKKLSLIPNNTGCFFYHEVVPLQRVSTVGINYFRLVKSVTLCLECLRYLNQSCPNINAWQLGGKILNISTVVKSSKAPLKSLNFFLSTPPVELDQTYPHLEILKIKRIQGNVMDMPKLHTLEMGEDTVMNDTALNQIIRAAPNVQHLTICAKEETKLGIELLTMTNMWNNLVVVIVEQQAYFPPEIGAIVFGNQHTKLRDVRIGVSEETEEKDEVLPLFKQIPTLRNVQSAHYSDYCLKEYGSF